MDVVAIALVVCVAAVAVAGMLMLDEWVTAADEAVKRIARAGRVRVRERQRDAGDDPITNGRHFLPRSEQRCA